MLHDVTFASVKLAQANLTSVSLAHNPAGWGATVCLWHALYPLSHSSDAWMMLINQFGSSD